MGHITTDTPDIASASITGMPESGEPTKCKCVVQQDASGLYTFHSAYYVKKVKVEPAAKTADAKDATATKGEAQKGSSVDAEGDVKMDDAAVQPVARRWPGGRRQCVLRRPTALRRPAPRFGARVGRERLL